MRHYRLKGVDRLRGVIMFKPSGHIFITMVGVYYSFSDKMTLRAPIVIKRHLREEGQSSAFNVRDCNKLFCPWLGVKIWLQITKCGFNGRLDLNSKLLISL